jgi:hypothetical protein
MGSAMMVALLGCCLVYCFLIGWLIERLMKSTRTLKHFGVVIITAVNVLIEACIGAARSVGLQCCKTPFRKQSGRARTSRDNKCPAAKGQKQRSCVDCL